jgi:hypothetical protein
MSRAEHVLKAAFVDVYKGGFGIFLQVDAYEFGTHIGLRTTTCQEEHRESND